MPTKITNQTNTQCSIIDCIETAADGVTQGAGGDTFSQCDCTNALTSPSAAGGAANIAKLFAVSAGVIGLTVAIKVGRECGDTPAPEASFTKEENIKWANRLIAQAEYEQEGEYPELALRSLQEAAQHLETAGELVRAAEAYYDASLMETDGGDAEEAQMKLDALKRSAELLEKAGVYGDAADRYEMLAERYYDAEEYLAAGEARMEEGEALMKGRFFLAARDTFEKAITTFREASESAPQIWTARGKMTEGSLRGSITNISIRTWLAKNDKNFTELGEERQEKRVMEILDKLVTTMGKKGHKDFTERYFNADGSVSLEGISEANTHYDWIVRNRPVNDPPQVEGWPRSENLMAISGLKAIVREIENEVGGVVSYRLKTADFQTNVADKYVEANLQLGDRYIDEGRFYAAERVYDDAARGMSEAYPAKVGIALLRKAGAMRLQGFAEENLYRNAIGLISQMPAGLVIEHFIEIKDVADRLSANLDTAVAGVAYDTLALALVKEARPMEAAELEYRSGLSFLKTNNYFEAAWAFDNSYRIAETAKARSAFKASVLLDVAPGILELVKWELGGRAKDVAPRPEAVRIAVEHVWPRARDRFFEMFVNKPTDYFFLTTQGLGDRNMLELEPGEIDVIYEKIMRTSETAGGGIGHLVDTLEARIEDVPEDVKWLTDSSVDMSPIEGPVSDAGMIVFQETFKDVAPSKLDVSDALRAEVLEHVRRAESRAAEKSEGLRLLLNAKKMERAGRPRVDVSAEYLVATGVLISKDPEYAGTHPDVILAAGRRLWNEGQYELAGKSFGKCAELFKAQGMNKLAAWVYTRQGVAFTRSGAHHWAAQAFYDARELYSQLNRSGGSFVEEKNKALERIQQAVKKDLLPQVESVLKARLGKKVWNSICRNEAAKTALVDHTYTRIQEEALRTFYDDARSPATEFANYGKLRNGGARELAAKLDIDAGAIKSIVEGAEAKPGMPEMPRRPGKPVRPTAIGRGRGRDRVDGKGRGRDKDAEGRKGPEGRRGRGPVK